MEQPKTEKQEQPGLDTDGILQVFQHLVNNEKSWSECIADHGLDPEKVKRAFCATWETGDGRHEVAVQAFVLGLQFGAMRLSPFEGYEEKPCECLICTLRRTAEAQARGDEGGA